MNGVTTNYLVDTNNLTGYAQVVEELQNGQVIKAYTYGHDLISQRQSSGVSFYNYDGHGSVRSLTDNLGQVTDTYDYDAFGNLIAQTGTTSNSYLYAGEQFDADLGFYYNRARYLNADSGRFISQDSYGGNQFEPESLHKYIYAENNAVNRIDPSGNISIVEASIVNSIQSVLVNSIANIGFATADQIRFGGDVGLESIAIGAIATVGVAVVARKVLPFISSRIAGWLRGASKESFFFRGTTTGWIGNPNTRRTGITSASGNPAIAHLFAAESASSGGSGVIHIASNVDLQGITLLSEGNFLANKEAEIAFDILPTQFAQRSQKTISIEQSKEILKTLGIDVPTRLYNNNMIDQWIETIPNMTKEQVAQYVRLAQSSN